MSPTATKPDALTELQQMEAVEQEAREHAGQLSRDLAESRRRLTGFMDSRGAVDELRHLEIRNPDQFDDDGAPKKGTEAASLAQEIAKLGDAIQRLTPQVDQARRREDAARLAREEFTRENVQAIVEAYRPEAEARRAAIQEKTAEDAAFWSDHIGFIQKLQGIVGTVPTQRHVRVPGLDTAADRKRDAERLEFPLPLPELRDV